MRTLSTDAAATALGVERKSLDNVLSREGRALVGRGRRGRSRRIPVDALERIAVAFVLSRDLGVGLAKGIELAGAIASSGGRPIPVGSLGVLSFDLPALRRALDRSIDEALESRAEPVRGRPAHRG